MYTHPFPVYEGETFEIPLPTRTAAGIPLDPDTAWADADFSFYKDGATSATSIQAAATTPSSSFDTQDGRSQLQVLTAQDAANFTLGSRWQVWAYHSDIDGAGTEVNECIGVFRIETIAQQGSRLFLAAMIQGVTVVNTDGNTTGLIDMQDFVPSTADDDAIAGEIWVLQYVGGDHDGETHQLRCTGYTKATQLGAFERLNGDPLVEAVGANDLLFRSDQFTAFSGSILDVAGEAQLSGLGENLLNQNAIPPENTAFTFTFSMFDEDGEEKAGLTPTVTVSKNGGAYGATTGTPTEIGNGDYQFAASAADMNGARLVFRCVGTGAKPTKVHIQTQTGV